MRSSVAPAFFAVLAMSALKTLRSTSSVGLRRVWLGILNEGSKEHEAVLLIDRATISIVLLAARGTQVAGDPLPNLRLRAWPLCAVVRGQGWEHVASQFASWCGAAAAKSVSVKEHVYFPTFLAPGRHVRWCGGKVGSTWCERAYQ